VDAYEQLQQAEGIMRTTTMKNENISRPEPEYRADSIRQQDLANTEKFANVGRGARLIFVSGAPRSGTTLVQNILDCHPDICGIPELLYLPDIFLVRRKLYTGIELGWLDLICSRQDVDRCIANFIESLLLPLADRSGCRFVSEKSPSHVVVFPELLEVFPAARFIHIVRDPRAVISSLLQVGIRAKARKKKGFEPSDRMTRLWASIEHVKSCLGAGFAAARAAPDRVLTVVYEKLVQNPEDETKRLCGFLGIEWNEKMLHPASVKHLGEKAIVNEVWYENAQQYYRDPDTSDIDKWKKYLTHWQQVRIAMAFKDFGDIGRFGYDLSTNSLSLLDRLVGSAWAGAMLAGEAGIAMARRIPILRRLKRALGAVSASR